MAAGVFAAAAAAVVVVELTQISACECQKPRSSVSHSHSSNTTERHPAAAFVAEAAGEGADASWECYVRDPASLPVSSAGLSPAGNGERKSW